MKKRAPLFGPALALRRLLSSLLRWIRDLSGSPKSTAIRSVPATHTFFLPFVDFGPGDSATGGGTVKDRIEFTANGAWTLRRLDESRDSKLIAVSEGLGVQSGSFLKSVSPAVLEITGPTLDQAQTDGTADDISWILSLALGQTVSWTHGYYQTPGQPTTFRVRGVHAPFAYGLQPPLANDSKGRLKNYLKAAYGNFAKDREWWQLSLGWWVQMHESNNVHIVGLLGSILLERASEFYLGEQKWRDQIDVGVDAFLNKRNTALLAGELDEFFRVRLTSKWEGHRSLELVRSIKGMNNSLPYGVKVNKACEDLGVPRPDSDWLKGRNNLAHQGELNEAITNLGAYHAGIRRTATELLLKLLTRSTPK